MNSIRPHLCILPAVLFFILALFMPACNRSDPGEISTFLLRSNTMNVNDISERFADILTTSLEETGVLPPGYPQLGQIKLKADPADADVQLMSCAPTPLLAQDEPRCLLLNEAGDFIRIQPITWESAAFFMYRLYVLPRSIFARVNLARDFVAIDIFLMQEATLWEAVYGAIRKAVTLIGARPYHP